MNQRELSEIKRRLNPDKRNPTMLRGCYITNAGQVISTFQKPVYHLPQEENEKYMAIFKRVLSGTLGQNLVAVDFDALQVMEGEEHRLLTALRDSGLKDDAAVDAVFQRVIGAIAAEHAHETQSVNEQQQAANYLILMLHDGYDVPYKNANDELDQEQSQNVFSYVLLGVCPVKQTKSALCYETADNDFHNRPEDWVVGMPEMGFLFPAFEERSANIYASLFYTKNSADPHEAFMQNVFGMEPIMPAEEQKETFQALLQETLEDECSLDVVQTVHDTVCTMIEERKADKTAAPLCLTKSDVKTMLETCGVSLERQNAFEEKYDQSFGSYAEIPAVNMVTPRQFQVETPSVSIRVDPAHSDLVQTRMIDGKCYIMVLADDNVKVNGVSVKIRG
ncbi:MAG: DUF4317 domain-containing protein [Clostridiales bacterium]|nr:DUF4317 domain-containing protein [Clostridiales bacterium]